MPEIKSDDTQLLTPVEGNIHDDLSDLDEGTPVAAEPDVTLDNTDVDTSSVEPEPDDVDLWGADGPPKEDSIGKREDVPPKKNPSRFEFQQSRADKAEAMLKQTLERLQALEAQSPAAKPAAEAKPNVTPEKTPAQDTLVKPSRPTRPANYDPVEAVTNPNSESAKYRFAMDDYQDKLTVYNETKAEIQERREAEAAAAAQAAAAQRQQIAGLASELKTKYGFNDSQVKDFLQTVTSDEAMTIENLVRFYQVTKTSKPDAKRRPAPRQAVLREPLPLSALSGAPNETVDEQDSFNLGLLRSRRKK
jgi:hypothetical protein